ncbi:MAG TPA: RagB/SusD family nutrient uptake outer membrane protein [Prolixibacteraceae bacterium]|nr:RagB/SusD family nutrient uptake outer membrane protein [Prolixibacteraceae bacterium]
MKKIKILIALTFILGFLSCSDSFLDIKPLSIFTPESIYTDETGFKGVLVTLRKNLRFEFYGQVGAIGCEIISSDMAIAANKGADAMHNYDTQLLPTGTGSTYNFFELWDVAYNQIRNANVVLSRIEKADIKNETTKKEIVAEALFHRSYWYYRLVHVFGDVPFLSKEYTEPKIDFYTHARKTILTKIQEDMNVAVLSLPVNVVPGAVSRAAGYHMLAKICLANSKFNEAVTAATAAINGGNSLMTARFGQVASDPKYNVIWDLHQKENKSLSNNKEALLVVQDKYGFPDAEVVGGTNSLRRYAPCWWNNYIKDPSGKHAMTDASGNKYTILWGRGVGYVRTINYYNYDIWKDPKDLRHDTLVNWFPTEKFVYNNPTSAYYLQKAQIKYSNAKDTIHCWFPFPYYKIYVADEERPLQPYGGHSDWYVFRLAETYLLRAEAYYWLNDLQKAADDINMVRNRAKATPVTAAQVDINYILDERARELYTEEPRKTELTRIAFIMAENNKLGYSIANFSTKNYWYDRIMEKNAFYKAGNILWGTNVYKLSPFHVLWPVPASAIESNAGGVINQNIGYIGSEKNQAPLTVIDNNQ